MTPILDDPQLLSLPPRDQKHLVKKRRKRYLAATLLILSAFLAAGSLLWWSWNGDGAWARQGRAAPERPVSFTPGDASLPTPEKQQTQPNPVERNDAQPASDSPLGHSQSSQPEVQQLNPVQHPQPEAQQPKPKTNPQPDSPPQSQPAPATSPAEPKQLEKKVVALTFDDGPDNRWTPQILDILKEHQVKATFFIVGQQAAKHPDMVKRIVDEGHALGNHTWSHRQLTKLNPEQIRQEIQNTDQILKELVGTVPVHVRAPYGAVSPQVLDIIRETGHLHVAWQIDPRDWSGVSAATMMDTVKRQLHRGSVLLLHCFGGKQGNLENTVTLLGELIPYLKSEGYTFVTVPDLTGTPVNE